jgi:hypothetical protein
MSKDRDRVRLVRQFISTPPNPEIDERKNRFEALNEFVQSRGGWVTSVPGATEVTVECLPDAALPDDLRGLGYDVREVGDGERILAHRIVERFVRRSDGELEPLTAESSKPIAETRTHAGIVKVKRYAFDIP